MTTRVRRARRSVVRQPAGGVSDLVVLGAAYRRARAAAGFAVFILIFGLLWLVNGSFTAVGVVRIFDVTIEWGWALHFAVTALELTPIFVAPYLRGGPRPLVALLLAISLPFGVFDVWSSAQGVQPAFVWTGATGILAHAQNTIVAELIAFAPEPMTVWLVVGLHNVLKGAQQ